jgi:hypothetical protein
MNRILAIAAVALALCAPVGAHASAINDPANPDLNTKAGFLSVIAAAKEAGGPPTVMCNRVVCTSTWSGSRFKLDEYVADGQVTGDIYNIYSKDQSVVWMFMQDGYAAKSVNGGAGQLIRNVWP